MDEAISYEERLDVINRLKKKYQIEIDRMRRKKIRVLIQILVLVAFDVGISIYTLLNGAIAFLYIWIPSFFIATAIMIFFILIRQREHRDQKEIIEKLEKLEKREITSSN